MEGLARVVRARNTGFRDGMRRPAFDMRNGDDVAGLRHAYHQR